MSKIVRSAVEFKKKRPYLEISQGNYVPRSELVETINNFVDRVTNEDDGVAFSFRMTICVKAKE